MNKLTFFVAVLGAIAPSAASAADWWFTGGAANRAGIYFVDRSSVQRVGGYTRAWVKLVPESTSAVTEILALQEVDCGQRRYRLLSQKTRSPDGRADDKISQPEWVFSAPESAIDSTVSAICGDQNSWIAKVQDTSLAAKIVFGYLNKR